MYNLYTMEKTHTSSATKNKIQDQWEKYVQCIRMNPGNPIHACKKERLKYMQLVHAKNENDSDKLQQLLTVIL